MKRWFGLAAALVAIAGGTVVAIALLRPAQEPPEKGSNQTVRPTLYCEFYNFMRNATVVSFNFAVGHDAEAKPVFTELFVVEPDGTKTDFATDPRRWVYGMDDGAPVITSPDSATRIVLYGLKTGVGGIFWTEAGVRSNTYKNLEGKCRQAHLDKIPGIGAKSSQ